MPIEINVGGVWKTVENIEVNVGGVWKTVDTLPVNVGGVWKDCYSNGPSVTVAATKAIIDFELSGTAYAYVRVASDGDLKSSTTSSSPTSVYETWLDAGSNTDVWVQMTIVSGTLTTSAGTSRLACTTDRTWGIAQVAPSAKTTVIDLDFYDAASGGNLLDSQRVTLVAEIDAGF